jgi:GNAT superfamily N-acetyltransferase
MYFFGRGTLARERTMKWQRGEFVVSDSRGELDIDAIHALLRDSYWARGIPRSVVVKALENSLCFGLYHNETQVGFARAITDRATFAYLADVIILPDYRGHGLGKWLLACVLEHPDLQGLRRLLLATSDAHGLYGRYRFTALNRPSNFMEISRPNPYPEDGEQGDGEGSDGR